MITRLPDGSYEVPVRAESDGVLGDSVEVVRQGTSEWEEWDRWLAENPVQHAFNDDALLAFDKDQLRGPDGRWRKVPGGSTSMFVTPARSEREDAEAYYATPRWKQFEAHVREQAKALGVKVEDEQRTQGIWSETPEPSATFTLSDGKAIDQLAARVGRRWDQDAVLNFTPGDGPDAEWHFHDVGADHDAATILRAAQDHGLFGATRNGSDIVVVAGPDMGGEDEAALRAFGEQLGAAEADRYPGSAHLIESEEYDQLDSQDQP